MAFGTAEIVGAFARRYPNLDRPDLYRAPGRVNLIGEHTDYNLGFVLPIALEMACSIAVAPSSDDQVEIYSQDFDDKYSFPLPALADLTPQNAWHDYVTGVAKELATAGFHLSPVSLLIHSTVPAGSGLSSSAALEIASALAFLGNQQIDKGALARLGQRAESTFVGMPCGIMDQYAAVFGRKHSALQIDCRSQTHQYAHLPDTVLVVAVNSMVKHALGSSAYRERVAECQQAVEELRQFDSSIESLRDATPGFFASVEHHLSPVPGKRARHIVSESQRVLDFSAAAESGDLQRMGRLFVESHESMRRDYEISCQEIDTLVEAALEIPGVYGARMTGGGFGGCTVNLVAPEALEEFRIRLGSHYRAVYGLEPVFYDCVPADGAGRVLADS